MKKAILVVSFGTTYDYARSVNINAIENSIKKYFDDYIVEEAFTSSIVIKRLKARGIEINNVDEALESLYNNGVEEVIIQPTHIINGYEYEKIADISKKFNNKFKNLVISSPLLYNDNDYEIMAKFLIEKFGFYSGTVILMGHGSEHSADLAYSRLQEKLKDSNIFIATVEGSVRLEDIIDSIKSENVLLSPFMVVSGDHAINDLSVNWKNTLKEKGFNAELYLRGLGEYTEIHNMYISHIKNAIK